MVLIFLSLAALILALCLTQRASPGSCLLSGGLFAAAALAGAGLSLWAQLPRLGALPAFAALTFLGGGLLLEAVCPPEEPRLPAAPWAGAAQGALLGASLPFLSPELLLWGAGLGGGFFCLRALSACLPEDRRRRLRPWLSAGAGLGLSCLGMLTLLGAMA